MLLTSSVFLSNGLQILNFLSNEHFQISMTKISLFFLHVPTRINQMNKLGFLFSHFFLLPQKEGLDTKKKRENENVSWFLFLQFCCCCCFLKYEGTVGVNKLILDSYNQLKQCDLSKKTLYIVIIQSLTGANIGLIWQRCADSSGFLLWSPK